MTQQRVLYAIYVPPGRARTLIDSIRLFARPQLKHPAHVTVRGPYPDYQDPRQWSAEVRGQTVRVGGVGTFFEDRQNTVFLHVESDALTRVWHKPDYPTGFPHLTIYDGESRCFADSLQGILAERNPRFTFVATGLEPMVLGNGQRPLRTFYDPSELTEFMTVPPTLPEIDAADDDIRLSWISALSEHLSATTCAV
jgi:hypothetical protein